MDGSRLVYRHDGKEEVIGTTDQFNLVGQCNYENIMAAAAIGTAMGVPMETIRQTAYNFKAVSIESSIQQQKSRFAITIFKGNKSGCCNSGYSCNDNADMLNWRRLR